MLLSTERRDSLRTATSPSVPTAPPVIEVDEKCGIEQPAAISVSVAESPKLKRVHHDLFPLLNSNIFSDHGRSSILHVVQTARIFADSKTFVDMKVVTSPERAQDAFDAMMEAADRDPDKETIAAYVEDHFTAENQMTYHEPEDWTPHPPTLASISDAAYRKFAHDLNSRWKTLSRKISPEVAARPELYTLIHLPHPVVVPGGRFREVYYWDSFWIVRGLLLCDMVDTARGMLLNFAHLIELYGKVPNGGRTYYVNRSQPPLFVQMVQLYYEATGDRAFVRANMEHMKTEFEYWMREHMVAVTQDGVEYKLARYNCEDAGPRPESYLEDYELAHAHGETVDDKARIYWEMKTGAETGWDYTSRWMIGGDGLEATKVRSIVPVDLNAFLERNARLLASFAADVVEDAADTKVYTAAADQLKRGMDAVLWNEADGVWYDFDLLNAVPRPAFTPSNLAPLWTGSHDGEKQAIRAVDYLVRQNLNTFPGGVPTTLTRSGQQWDFPNCWPPLEHMLVQGLEKTGLPEAKELAFSIAERRVRGSYANFVAKEHMFEKYDCTAVERIGGGGEYDVQIGFGWTNGVVLDFLTAYADRLSSSVASGAVKDLGDFATREP